MLLWRLIRVVPCISSLFSLLSGSSCCGYTTVCQTIHPLKDFWVVSVLDNRNKVTVNSCVQVFEYKFPFLGDKHLKCTITEFYGNCRLSSIRNCQTATVTATFNICHQCLWVNHFFYVFIVIGWCYFFFLNESHSNRYMATSCCCFNLHFPSS